MEEPVGRTINETTKATTSAPAMAKVTRTRLGTRWASCTSGAPDDPPVTPNGSRRVSVPSRSTTATAIAILTAESSSKLSRVRRNRVVSRELDGRPPGPSAGRVLRRQTRSDQAVQVVQVGQPGDPEEWPRRESLDLLAGLVVSVDLGVGGPGPIGVGV